MSDLRRQVVSEGNSCLEDLTDWWGESPVMLMLEAKATDGKGVVKAKAKTGNLEAETTPFKAKVKANAY